MFLDVLAALAAQDPVVELWSGVTDLLKTGGPYAVAVIAGAYGVYKDRQLSAQQKETYTALSALNREMTAAMIEQRRTIESLKDVLQRVGVCHYPRRGGQ